MDPAASYDPASAMDFEFSLDIDHRKRRRNRTTQSCLNCHTSKRKCDRKRPCQRCIQLGLTGLCVYEIDDPALRDDPNVDEGTRLRNRIAELESLVRELRGKPHPRWADANFCDGDPAEKWHSRALKRPPGMQLNLKRRRPSLDLADASPSAAGTPIKSEPGDLAHAPFPYRFTPSPDSQAASPYHAFPPSTHAYPDPAAHVYAPTSEPASSPAYSPYSAHPAYAHDDAYRQHPHAHTHAHAHAHPAPAYCACIGNPAAAHPLIALAQQLHGALGALRALPEHAAGSAQCAILRRLHELSDLLHGTGADYPASYDALATPPESEIITPLSSAESAPSRAAQIQEWHALAAQAGAGSYNPYFPPLPAGAKDLEEYHAHGVL